MHAAGEVESAAEVRLQHAAENRDAEGAAEFAGQVVFREEARLERNAGNESSTRRKPSPSLPENATTSERRPGNANAKRSEPGPSLQ